MPSLFDRPLYYLLDEQGQPYPSNDIRAANDLLIAIEKRRVAQTSHEGAGHSIFVSTVFLVIDHSHLWLRESPPTLYETMLFVDGEEIGSATRRYETREQAQSGHEAIVADVEQVLLHLGQRNLDTVQIAALLMERRAG